MVLLSRIGVGREGFTVAGGEELLWVRFAHVAFAAQGFGHGQVDFEVFAIHVPGVVSWAVDLLMGRTHPTRAPTTVARAV